MADSRGDSVKMIIWGNGEEEGGGRRWHHRAVMMTRTTATSITIRRGGRNVQSTPSTLLLAAVRRINMRIPMRLWKKLYFLPLML